MAANGVAQGFTKDDLDGFESMLLERRSGLVDDVRALQDAEARNIPESAISSHLADLGSERAASDLSLGRMESEIDEIQQIDDALDRIRDGAFGTCEMCDETLSRARLEAIPYARLCLRCKSLEEGRR